MHTMRFFFSHTHGPVIITLAFNVVRLYGRHKYLHFRGSKSPCSNPENTQELDF